MTWISGLGNEQKVTRRASWSSRVTGRGTRLAGTIARWVLSLGIVGGVTVPALVRAQVSAGAEDSVPENIRQAHMVHVSPHVIVFDPTTRSATLEFSNPGGKPTQADVEVLFAYPYWPATDTVMIDPDWRRMRWRDTVIVNPDPSAPFAGRWISGVPTHVALRPGETKRVTVRIDPPKGLRDGEYWARIVAVVRADKMPTSKDASPKRTDASSAFKLPISGKKNPEIRDSVRVFYRQGKMWMGVEVANATGAIDRANISGPQPDFGSHQLWLRIPARLTGPVHFEGHIRFAITNLATGEVIPANGLSFSFYDRSNLRFWAMTRQLAPGPYRMDLFFEDDQSEFPAQYRVPMKPAQASVLFRVP